MIIVFGSINMDLVFSPENAPEAGETILLKDYLTLPGGKGANQAVACAKMGASVKLAGCVGDDGFGKDLLDFISAQKVDISLTRSGQTNTGTAIITVEANGENRIMVASGTNLETHSGQVPDSLLTKGSSLLMQMETSAEEILSLTKKAAGKVDRIILNLAPALPVSGEVLSNIDILVLNEIEIIHLAKNLGLTADDVAETAIKIAGLYDLVCIITLGGKGAIAFEPDGTTFQSKALVIEPIVDTTGAGDAFCGTLAAMLDHGRSLEEALSISCIAGSLACMKKGAMSSYPDFETVMGKANAR